MFGYNALYLHLHLEIQYEINPYPNIFPDNNYCS